MNETQNSVFSMPYSIGPEEIENEYHHVHHAQSLRLLEKARLSFMESIACPNEKYIDQGLFLVITSIEIAYKRELFEEEVRISCEDARIEGRKVIVKQRILNSKGKTAVEALVTSMFMNGELRRAVLPPDDFVQAFLSPDAK